VVLLEAFDSNGKTVLSTEMSFTDFYDTKLELIDSSSFRRERNISKVHGLVYDSKGTLVEDFWNNYSESGERTHGSVRYEDGTTQED